MFKDRANERSRVRKAIRCATGSSLLETVALLSISVPLLLAVLDGCVYISAMKACDDAARLAARAASMGAPSSYQKGCPEQLAKRALQSFPTNGKLIQFDDHCVVSESMQSALPDPAFGGNIDASVTVLVNCRVTMPFSCPILLPNVTTISAHQTVPFTWRMPAVCELPSSPKIQASSKNSPAGN